MVSRTLAWLFWHDSSPLGRGLKLPDGTVLPALGIAKDIDPLRVGGTDNPPLYRSPAANASNDSIAIRFGPRLKRPGLLVHVAIREIDPDLPVRILLMQNFIDNISAEIWNFVSLILLHGLLATILSAAGIYGAVSFAVNQSAREFTIRAALGARRVILPSPSPLQVADR